MWNNRRNTSKKGTKQNGQRQGRGPSVCGPGISFEACELAILREAVDESEKTQGSKAANSPEVQRIIEIVEQFLVKKRLICYGGTAINNILPKFDQFYDRSIEIPDYDFFSKSALEDAKELADVYAQAGYDEIEAKSGMHPGTFKVYVNFIPVADVTNLHHVLFDALAKEVVEIAGILYAPPNYLRMGMYLELSRPQGDVSRWEKVLKRITLLNKHYPLTAAKPCSLIDFQRPMDVKSNQPNADQLYYEARNALIDLQVVFFGGYGVSLYSRYMPAAEKRNVEHIPDFDVLVEDPEHTASVFKKRLMEQGFRNIRTVVHTAIGEVIPYHVQVVVGGDTIAVLYKPLSCHSYNTIQVDQKEVRVATIDTMLSIYLAFIYGNKPYFNKDRIMCMAMYLFNVQQKNRLTQKGLLKRFSLSCYGNQETLEEIRAEKAAKFNQLKTKKNDPTYDYWFLRYKPLVEPKESSNHASVDKRAPPSKTYELVPTKRSVDVASKMDSPPLLQSKLESLKPAPKPNKPKRKTTQKRKQNKSEAAWPY
jgi:hypothetical protein